MENSDLRQKLPGHIATGLLITSTALWTLWGTIVMYHEGWGSALPPMWLYLIPALISLALALFALTWPRTVGWLLIALGGLFGLWWLIMAAGRARLIQGKGVTLIWAPEGPGWNWKQPDGWYASWSQIALFGLPPTGL